MIAVVESFADIIKAHSHFLSALESLQSEATKGQKVGGAFMAYAQQLKDVHLNYCGLHPHFVSIIEKNRDAVNGFMKKATKAEVNGSVLLTSSLSHSFRRLDKYPALLQELQRYTDECHPDRGDTQRAGFLYRELVSATLELRRQKEMELEVMLGNIKNWPVQELGVIDTLGAIVQMGPVNVLQSPEGSELKKDRYLVLFEANLIILSISSEMTSFSFEFSLPLKDMTMPRLPEASNTKQVTFELLSPGTAKEGENNGERFILQCTSVEEVRNWIGLMTRCKASERTMPKSPRNARGGSAVSGSASANTASSLGGSIGGSFRRSNKEAPLIQQQAQSSITASAQNQRQQTASLKSNFTSESSSLSSGSSLGFTKKGAQLQEAQRSAYWANRSLLPHPPLRSPFNQCLLENGLKSNSSNTLSSSTAAATLGGTLTRSTRPNSPSDDMAILQCIEAYYFTGKKNQPKNEGAAVKVVESDASVVESDQKAMVTAVAGLSDEVRQMRAEIDSLADCLRKERRARKRLKHFVEKLTFDSDELLLLPNT